MKVYVLKATVLIFICNLISGCGTAYRKPLESTPHSNSRTEQPAALVETSSDPKSGELKLADATSRALAGNPQMALFSYDIRAADARGVQAGYYPNPQFGYEVSEYGRDKSGLDSAEKTILIEQEFELGGKRRYRLKMAQAESEMAQWHYAKVRLETIAETTKRFMAVIAAQERLKLIESTLELSEKIRSTVSDRVESGKDSPVALLKVEAELALAQCKLLENKSSLHIQRRKLASMWGEDKAEFTKAKGDFTATLTSIPTIESLLETISKSPELARLTARSKFYKAALSAARAERIPDLEATIGYQSFEEDYTNGYIVGIGVPIPVFNRNRGNTTAAEEELSRASAAYSAAELKLKSELAQAHIQLISAHQQITNLQEKVIPAMYKAYTAAEEGYKQGKFEFLEMLDSQRLLFASKARLVSSTSDYLTAKADLQRITGVETNIMQNKENRRYDDK